MTSKSQFDTYACVSLRARRGIVGRVYIAEYSAPPSQAELNEIADDIDTLLRRVGAPVHYLGIVKPSAEVPTPAHRDAMAIFGARINSLCDSAHLVLEGDGFRNAIQRSVITAVHVFKRQSVTCYRTVDDACVRLATLLSQDVKQVRRSIDSAFDWTASH